MNDFFGSQAFTQENYSFFERLIEDLNSNEFLLTPQIQFEEETTIMNTNTEGTMNNYRMPSFTLDRPLQIPDPMSEIDIQSFQSLSDFCSAVSQDDFDKCYNAYFDLVNPNIPIIAMDKGDKRELRRPVLQLAIAFCGAPFSFIPDSNYIQFHLANALIIKMLQEVKEDKLGNMDTLEALTMIYSRKSLIISGFKNIPKLTSKDCVIEFENHVKDLFTTLDLYAIEGLAKIVYTSLEYLRLSNSQTYSSNLLERKRLLSSHIFIISSFEAFDGQCQPIESFEEEEKKESCDQDKIQERIQAFFQNPDDDKRYIDVFLIIARFAHHLASKVYTIPVKRLGMPLITVLWAIEILEGIESFLKSIKFEFEKRKEDRIQIHSNHQRIYILQFLLLNLRMQFVTAFEHYSIRQYELCTLQGQASSMRIMVMGIETGLYVSMLANICMEKESIFQTRNISRRFTYIQLLPSFVRDIIAGTCSWFCEKRKKNENDEKEINRTMDYTRHISTLYSAVVSAKTYLDTPSIATSLDPMIQNGS